MDILTIILTFIAVSLFLLFLYISIIALKVFSGQSIKNPNYPPVHGTVFHELFYYRKLLDYHTETAKKHRTFRVLGPGQSDTYTTDIRNIEHILKTNFDKYCKGKYNQDIVVDLFGQGIFAVDGDKWRQQRKLASFEFSTRVLRDYSFAVFRRNATKLVRIVHKSSNDGQAFDMQASNQPLKHVLRPRFLFLKNNISVQLQPVSQF